MSPTQVIPDNAKNFWLFYILPNGSVVLNGSLDYATNTFYQLKILAQVGGGVAGARGTAGGGLQGGINGPSAPRTAGGRCTG